MADVYQGTSIEDIQVIVGDSAQGETLNIVPLDTTNIEDLEFHKNLRRWASVLSRTTIAFEMFADYKGVSPSFFGRTAETEFEALYY